MFACLSPFPPSELKRDFWCFVHRLIPVACNGLAHSGCHLSGWMKGSEGLWIERLVISSG